MANIKEQLFLVKHNLRELREKFSILASVVQRIMAQYEELERQLIEKGVLREGQIDSAVEAQAEKDETDNAV